MIIERSLHASEAVIRLLVAIGLAIGVFTTAASPAAADAPAPTTAASKYEVRFLTGMMEHHMMAVEMAEKCLERATHDELLTLCQEIITTQTEEMHLMHMWLIDWYGVDHMPHEMNPGQMRQMEKLAELSGEDFEIAFMRMMIRHHRQAVVEAEQCVDRAYHTELVELCQGIIETQSAEIEQMQTWLCGWYGICRD